MKKERNRKSIKKKRKKDYKKRKIKGKRLGGGTMTEEKCPERQKRKKK